MNDEHLLRRRQLLGAGAGLLVAGSAAAQDSRPAKAPPAKAPLIVYLVRHAEKAKAGGRDPQLSEKGKTRATELARVLGHVPLDAIYSTNTTRTRTTAEPVAKAKGLKVRSYRPGQLGAHLASGKGGRCVLVVGHSNTTPSLVRRLGGDYAVKILSGYDDLFLVVGHEGAGLLQHLSYGPPSTESGH
jgi:phosphohistidine phosphatase SixA